MNAQSGTIIADELPVVDFRLGMRRLASGVTVITTCDGGRPSGLLATSVASASAEPPTLMVSINRQSMSHDPILGYGAFCVSILSAGQETIASQFADPSRRNERFGTGEWTEMQTGCLALAGATATFDCYVVGCIRYHSHTIFLGQVGGVRVGSGDLNPLLHYNRQYGPLHSFDCAEAAGLR